MTLAPEELMRIRHNRETKQRNLASLFQPLVLNSAALLNS
jgi:hypothetical protein